MPLQSSTATQRKTKTNSGWQHLFVRFRVLVVTPDTQVATVIPDKRWAICKLSLTSRSTHARARAHTHTHTRTRAHARTHARTHTHTHTHTHSWVQWSLNADINASNFTESCSAGVRICCVLNSILQNFSSEPSKTFSSAWLFICLHSIWKGCQGVGIWGSFYSCLTSETVKMTVDLMQEVKNDSKATTVLTTQEDWQCEDRTKIKWNQD